MSRCEYLGHCVNETLRIDPSVRISTPHDISESITLGGVRVIKGQSLFIYLAYLQVNPEQWVEPLEYIPERWDPKVDKYYLTPAGKRRHPMSFSPFLGGRRVCIGKTLAESTAKCVLAVMMSQL